MQCHEQRATVAVDGAVEMFLRRLAVVLIGDALAVSLPLIDDMGRVIVQEFGRSAASQVDPQTRPRFHARAFDDPLELSSQVDAMPIDRATQRFAAMSANGPLHQELAQRLLAATTEVRGTTGSDDSRVLRGARFLATG